MSVMKRIAVDMDGVIADSYAHFIEHHRRETGILKSREESIGISEAAAFPFIRKHILTPGFFRDIPVISGSQEILKELNNKYELFIVSAATEFPQSLSEKQAWLNEFFPFLGWQQMVFCGWKTIIKADIMVDDHFKNLDHFEGQTFLFNQPHNQLADPGRHTRVFNWEEIGTYLL